MIESRCGCVCSLCSYREKENCAGCIKMDKPFWSDSCDLKTCCEGKKYEFCGECPDFPCETLSGMAGGDAEYEYGCRIERCKLWMADKGK